MTYNRLLRCFALFDLKIGKLKHEDIEQMQMYVNYYDRKVKMEDENPAIGIIIFKDKKDAVIEMILPENNNQIFASKYQTVLPSKEELQQLLEDKNLGLKIVLNKRLEIVFRIYSFIREDVSFGNCKVS